MSCSGKLVKVNETDDLNIAEVRISTSINIFSWEADNSEIKNWPTKIPDELNETKLWQFFWKYSQLSQNELSFIAAYIISNSTFLNINIHRYNYECLRLLISQNINKVWTFAVSFYLDKFVFSFLKVKITKHLFALIFIILG